MTLLLINQRTRILPSPLPSYLPDVLFLGKITGLKLFTPLGVFLLFFHFFDGFVLLLFFLLGVGAFFSPAL